MNAWFNYIATLKILIFGLLVGAGLPALFACGIRLRIASIGSAGAAGTGRRPVLLALSWTILALVVTAALLGVLFIARDFIGRHTGWYILGAKAT